MMRQIRDYRKHDARYGRVTGFYTFAFDVGVNTSMLQLAERLLKAEIAETIVVPGSGEVRLSHRYKSLARVVSKAKAMIGVEEYLGKERSWASLTWRGRWFLLRILGLALYRSLLSKNVDNDRDADSKTSIKEAMQEVVTETNEAVFDRQTYGAVHDFVDRSVYQFDYLETVPYVRLELKRFQAKIPVGNASDKDSWPIDVRPTLLLHRSGVALLTFGFRLPESLTSVNLASMLTGVELLLSNTTISEPVLRAAAGAGVYNENRLGGSWLSEIREGTRWRVQEHNEPVSLVDIFDLYQDSVLRYASTKYRHGGWVCYPTFFVEQIQCCGNKKRWMRRHRSELVAILARINPGAVVTEEVANDLLQPDFSLTPLSSFWSPGGCAVQVDWNFEGEQGADVDDYFRRLVVVENALIKYWQLRTLDDRLGGTPPNLKKVEKLLLEVASGLTEYRKPLLTFGLANEISAHTVGVLGGREYYESISSRLGLLQQLIAMRESVKASKRANRFAAAAMLAAVLLGLPAIKQSLEIVQKVPNEGWFGAVGHLIQVSPDRLDALAWSVYLSVLGIAFLLLILRRIRRKEKIGKFTRPPTLGTAWPYGHLRVKSDSRRVPYGTMEHELKTGEDVVKGGASE